MKICSIENCGNIHNAKGLCEKHYYRLRRNGDPLLVKRKFPLLWLKDNVQTKQRKCLKYAFALAKDGRGQVHYNGKLINAARVMCILAHGEPPTPKHQAAHSCGKGNQGCVNPRHLRWATKIENERDKIKHGTILKGSRHGGSKLKEKDIVIIRSLEGSMLQSDIAKRFNVSVGNINDILCGRTWSWFK